MGEELLANFLQSFKYVLFIYFDISLVLVLKNSKVLVLKNLQGLGLVGDGLNYTGLFQGFMNTF